ncbi:unnamed protein product, partial [Closterium sp. Naga37s-1]
MDLTPEEINEIVALRGELPQAVVGEQFALPLPLPSYPTDQRNSGIKGEATASGGGEARARDVEVVLPIVFGSCAFWLGKKADENATHKWTVYVRAADNGDLGSVVKKVVFQLHPSFSNPTRIVERPPFMLSESGWGEFEIAMTIVFHADASEMPAELTHHLRLYPEGSAPNQPLSTKRPVVAEQYDELVFCEPQIAFFHRIRSNPMVRIHGSEEAITAAGNHAAIPQDGSSSAPTDARNLESELRGENRGDTLDHPLSQWFLQFSDEQELTAIAAARKQ